MIAGIATAIVISNNDSSSEGYTIVDGSGKEIKVPAKMAVKFKVGKNFKDLIAGTKAKKKK